MTATSHTPSMETTEQRAGTREEWLDARVALLEQEKELTRRSDELARQRQALPWVRIDKEYSFETGSGEKTLAELFEGRSQLMVYHFMFGPDWDAGCPSCTLSADGFDGQMVHLNQRDHLRWRTASSTTPTRPSPAAATS